MVKEEVWDSHSLEVGLGWLDWRTGGCGMSQWGQHKTHGTGNESRHEHSDWHGSVSTGGNARRQSELTEYCLRVSMIQQCVRLPCVRLAVSVV